MGQLEVKLVMWAYLLGLLGIAGLFAGAGRKK